MPSKDCKRKKTVRNRSSKKDTSKKFPPKKALIASALSGKFPEEEPVWSWLPVWARWT